MKRGIGERRKSEAVKIPGSEGINKVAVEAR